MGRKRQVREPKLIEELWYKQIINFAHCLYYVMALTSYGKAYSWGRNVWRVLGNEKKIMKQ